MSEGFERFRARIMRHLLIRALLCGAAAGLFAAAVFLAVCKLVPLAVHPLLAAPVGLAVAAGVWAVLFFCLRPSDRAIAKRLDAALSLPEKAQTMVAFAGESGDMVALQRADTDEKLKSLPVSGIKYKNLWRHALAVALACALLVTALIIPGVAVEQPGYELSDWQVIALRELIRDVRASAMQADAKDAVITELEGLITALPGAGDETGARLLALGVIVKVDLTVNGVNSAPEIAAAMQASALASVNSLASVIGTYNAVSLRETLTAIRAQFTGTNAAVGVRGFADELVAVLDRAGIAAGDPLYDAVCAFANALIGLADQADNYSASWLQTELQAAFTAAEGDTSDILVRQGVNASVGKMVIDRLAEIFDIPTSDLPGNGGGTVDPEKPEDDGGNRPGTDVDEPEKDDEDDKLHEGGFGSGEIIYGSDDIIYYPDENRFVSYGEVIDAYYAKVIEQLASSDLTPEMKQYITDYFTSLFTGIEETEETN